MLRRLAAASFLLVLGLGIALADEYRGKVKSTDPDKNQIVVTVDDRDQTFTVTRDTEFYTQKKGKKGQPGKKTAIPDGLRGIKEGSNVTVTTEKKDGKETVTSVKVEKGKKKKKQDKE